MQDKLRSFIFLSFLCSFFLHIFIYTLAARLDLTASFFAEKSTPAPPAKTSISISTPQSITPESRRKAIELLKLLSGSTPEFSLNKNLTSGDSSPELTEPTIPSSSKNNGQGISNLPTPAIPSLSIPVIKIEEPLPNVQSKPLPPIPRTHLATAKIISPSDIPGLISGTPKSNRNLEAPSLPSVGRGQATPPLATLQEKIPSPSLKIPIPTLKQPATERKILDSLLAINTEIYQTATDKYFRINLRTLEESSRLRKLPKDLLFLIDTSGSISYEKLRHFKRAISQEVRRLPQTDRFNIVEFKNTPRACFSDYQEPGQANYSQVDEFLNKLKNSGKTNILNAVRAYIPQENPKRPLLIFLLTDGKITDGDIRENAPFIQAITQLNDGKATISSFGSGTSTNKFMLNFLSYRNRGYTKLEKNIDNTTNSLARFLKNTANALVINLNYYINSSAEVYPQKLPHLYSGKELSIYGKVPHQQEEVVLRITGISGEGTGEELLAKIDLTNSFQGSETIARNWASQKIYHIIGESTKAPNEELNKTARDLSKEFNIPLPFTPVIN